MATSKTNKRKSMRPNKSLAPKAGLKKGYRYDKGGKLCK